MRAIAFPSKHSPGLTMKADPRPLAERIPYPVARITAGWANRRPHDKRTHWWVWDRDESTAHRACNPDLGSTHLYWINEECRGDPPRCANCERIRG